jgi:hypothetical protein
MEIRKPKKILGKINHGKERKEKGFGHVQAAFGNRRRSSPFPNVEEMKTAISSF